MRTLPGLPFSLLLCLALLAGCPYEGQTTTTRAPPPSSANITKRQDQDVELTARVPVIRKAGPLQLPVTIHVENRGGRRVRLRQENVRLVASDGTTHEVSRTRTADAGQAGWAEHILAGGEHFDGTVWFDDVDPLSEQLTLDAFYTDVETGERGPELAVPVKTRPDAAATARDGRTAPN
ncbi:MAG TPA: hypothetical protein VLQ79_08885 [Myxococcaceae bacterium]|nr:hypothetical protein [Myxococcaceae bacterium]